MRPEHGPTPLATLSGQNLKEPLVSPESLISPPHEQENMPKIRGHRAQAFIHLLLTRRSEGKIAKRQELDALHNRVDQQTANMSTRQQIRYLRKKLRPSVWEIYTDIGQGYGIRKKGEKHEDNTTLPDGKEVMIKKSAQGTLNSIIAAGEQGISIEVLAQPYIDTGMPPKSAIHKVHGDIKSIRDTFLGTGYNTVNLTPRGARYFGIKAVYAFKILAPQSSKPR